MIGAGPARPYLSLPRQVPAGLDDLAGRAAGRRRDLAARCRKRRLRRHRRPARPLPRTAIWLNGGISSLTAMTEIFVKQRKDALTGAMRDVGIEDASAVLTRFPNGSLGTFEATRYARGHKAASRSRSTARTARSPGTCATSTAWLWFDHRTPGALGGWTSILVYRRRAPLSRQMVGAGPDHQLRALASCIRSADFLEGPRQGQPGGADLPRRAGDHARLRRDHRLGPERPVGRSRRGRAPRHEVRLQPAALDGACRRGASAHPRRPEGGRL